MLGLGADEKQSSKIADFYHGKSVFITGASGFVGTVLLETLLRCCPEIKFIYILLRPRKNVQPDARKGDIFNKKVFERLLQENPQLVEKVHVIPGEASLPNFGISEEDTRRLTDEVSIVFNIAASTHFSKPLKFSLLNNVISWKNVIELSRKMKKLEALVYTSTAYSNCNHKGAIVKEEVYRLPFRADKFLDALRTDDDAKLQELVCHCKPDWPNGYTFSKCLAENLIMDTASDLPIVVIRPSVVIGTWKHPIPGYEEENSGRIEILKGVGKGLLKVVHSDPKSKLDCVPVDIVANTHVIAAWSVGTKRCTTPMVVNCTANEKFRVPVSEYFGVNTELAVKYPMPLSFMENTKCHVVSNNYVYFLAIVYYHFLPAIVYDGIQRLLGKKPRILKVLRFLEKVMSTLVFFLSTTFEFERTNMEQLDKLIHPDDRKDLALDFNDTTFREVTLSLAQASPFYDWKKDTETPSERQRTKQRNHFIFKCIHGTFITIFSLFIYWMFSLIFL